MPEAGPSTTIAVATAATMEALQQLAPREVPVMEPLIEPLVEMAAGGSPVALEVLRGVGRFGDAELVSLALVALIVEALTRSCPVSPDLVRSVAQRVRSPAAAERSDEIAACVRQILARHGRTDEPTAL